MSDIVDKPTIAQRIVRVVLALAVLAAGIAVMRYLIATKPEPPKVERENLGQLVEVAQVKPEQQLIEVLANGQVVPAKAVSLSAEVGGRITWMNEKIVPGGRLSSGDKLVRIDGRDYRLALEQQRSMVNSAQTALEVERSRKAIAEKEWQIRGNGKPAAGTLALRDPQMRSAEASLKAAQSGFKRARLAAGKTLLKAPFNSIVQQKSADVGQLVGPQVPLLTLVGSDAFWVQVSIPINRLTWIDVPGLTGATEGSDARVVQEVGEQRICRKGKVLRLLGDLDPMGRMARLLIEIPDPMLEVEGTERCAPKEGLQDSPLPLLVGAYVSVEIAGKQVADVIELSREAVRNGNQVYVMTPDDVLDIRDVDIVWRKPEQVLIGGGLKAGERVVTSPLPSAAQGMKLRIPDQKARTTADGEPARGGGAGAGDKTAEPGPKPPEKAPEKTTGKTPEKTPEKTTGKTASTTPNG